MGETKKLPLKREDGAKNPVKKEQPAQVNRWEQVQKFIRGTRTELKKVHWPDRPTVITFTGVVLVAVFLVSFMIWVVDSGLGYLLELVLKR